MSKFSHDDDDPKGYDNTSTVSSKTAELTTIWVTARFGPKYFLKGLLNQTPPTRPRGYKTFFMLNSVEHEILNAHKYKNIWKFGFFKAQICLKWYFPAHNIYEQEKFHA